MRKVNDQEFLELWSTISVQGTSIADCMLLYQAIVDHKYSKILEIGAMLGSSSLWMLKALNDLEHPYLPSLTIIDPNLELWGGRGTSQKAQRDNLLALLEDMMPNQVDVSDLEMTSDEFFAGHDPIMKFDMVFIDGDHSYEGCSKDLENSLKVSNHVFIHDYYHDDGVKKACDEMNDRIHKHSLDYVMAVHNTERGMVEIRLRDRV